jgi:hypothetical protein
MAVTQTIAQKIAQYSYYPKEKWSKTATSLHHNPHPEKLATQCSGRHLTSQIPRPTLYSFQHKLTQTITKDNLCPIINLITTPQPTTPSLRQSDK